VSEQSGFQVDGTIVDLLPNRLYRVRLASGSVISAHVDSTLQMKLVRLIPGDEVAVKLSDVDPSRGRIIRRLMSDWEMKR
jgi:translation initiation factor IF-1